MKLAYDPSMFRDSMTLKQMFDEVARLGYEYVELSPAAILFGSMSTQ